MIYNILLHGFAIMGVVVFLLMVVGTIFGPPEDDDSETTE